jgi:hypothetical protein
MCPREASCRRRAELWRIRLHAFKQQFDLKDVHFVVDATNEGSLNQLTITSTGLNESAAGFPTPANTHLFLHHPSVGSQHAMRLATLGLALCPLMALSRHCDRTWRCQLLTQSGRRSATHPPLSLRVLPVEADPRRPRGSVCRSTRTEQCDGKVHAPRCGRVGGRSHF